MKILKTKTYNELLNKIEHLEKTRDDYCARLVKAEDLKEILKKVSSPDISVGDFLFATGSGHNIHLELGDDVLVYVEDILGGKVIKQEGTKCLVVDNEGNVKTGLTKQKPDKGFTYKLVRE